MRVDNVQSRAQRFCLIATMQMREKRAHSPPLMAMLVKLKPLTGRNRYGRFYAQFPA